MRHDLKTVLIIPLIFINIWLPGCLSDRRAGPPQSSSSLRKSSQSQSAESVILDVPVIPQKPELKSGCEVTSLAMLLQFAGVKVDKMELAEKIKKDETPLVTDEDGNIKKWGDPDYGFVGDITGKNEGFAVYPGPLTELMEQYIPERAVSLTGQPFGSLLKSIEQKHPVIVWVTIDFKQPKKNEEWEKDGKKIRATLDEHAVLLVGYDSNYCYINNPFDGVKNQKIDRDTFIKIWKLMGCMAVSYK